MGEQAAEIVPWQKITKIKATVTFTCPCGGEHETDFRDSECDGTTSIEWKCDDCGSPLLVYVDVDARSRFPAGETQP